MRRASGWATRRCSISPGEVKFTPAPSRLIPTGEVQVHEWVSPPPALHTLPLREPPSAALQPEAASALAAMGEAAGSLPAVYK